MALSSEIPATLAALARGSGEEAVVGIFVVAKLANGETQSYWESQDLEDLIYDVGTELMRARIDR